MGDACRLLIALAGAAGFSAVALLAFVAVRVEQAHRRRELPPEPAPEPSPPPPAPPSPPCGRLHASDVAESWLDRQRAGADGDYLTAEELPGFRGQPREVVDLDRRAPLDEELVNPLLSGRGP